MISQHCCAIALFQMLEKICDFRSASSCTQRSFWRASLLIFLEVTMILSCILLEERTLFTNWNMRHLLHIQYFNCVCFLAIAF